MKNSASMRSWNWQVSAGVLLDRKQQSLFCARKQYSQPYTDLAALRKELMLLPSFPECDWGNFRRGSSKVREFLIASAALFYDGTMTIEGNIAVIAAGRNGSHEQNLEYYRDYEEFGKTSGRGHLFVGTIPTTPMCEAAIAVKAHGPAYYLDTMDDFDMVYEDAELLLQEDESIPFAIVFFDFSDRLFAFIFKRGNTLAEENLHPSDLLKKVPPAKKSVCVIPVYNNASTVADVVRRAQSVMQKNVLVIDDGSTDADLREKLADLNVEVIRHETNQGKGAALQTALKVLQERSVDYMITLDADGQHYPEDLPTLLARLEEKEGALLVGCRDFNDPNVPSSSRFGRKFSNFWMGIETGITVDDCQSGFRAYPVPYVSQIRCYSRHYNFETEILTRSAWANLPILNHDIRSYYPVREERISHFKPWKDNVRISLVHLMLVLRHLLPIPHKKLIPGKKLDLSVFKPKRFFHYLLTENITPGGLAAAAFTGTLLAVLPLFGLHGAVILYAASCLHLNKVVAFNVQHLFMPPLTPFLCIELGYFLLNGRFLRDFTMETLVHQCADRILEWLLGSLILAPVFACIMGVLVYFMTLGINRFRKKKDRTHG